MTKQKRLMVLGAGPGQLPIIEKALAMGLYVITVDNIPENPGHRLAQQTVHCSTVDCQGVVRAAREHQIHGIVTFASDVATVAAACVAERFRLPGCSLDAAQIMSNKAHFRAFQHRCGQVSTPHFVAGSRLDDLFDSIQALTPPVMFKPVDTSGSRGISRVDDICLSACETAWDLARGHSRSQTVCVEEYVEGIHCSGDGFLMGGRLFAVITDKYKQGYVPTGHSLPTRLERTDRRRVLIEVTENCAALGYSNGPIDFDVVVTPNRVTVIEISPRLGGNGIPTLIQRATGIDLTTATVSAALGAKVNLPVEAEVRNPCGSLVFGSQSAGVLRRLASAKEVHTAVPEVFEYAVHYEPGDSAPAFLHSGNRLGHALFDCCGPADYQDVILRIEDALQLEVDLCPEAIPSLV